MDAIKEFIAVLGGSEGTTGQRVLYYACIVLVLAILIFILVNVRKAKKRKHALDSSQYENGTGKGFAWKDRRRNALGLPFSFERYRLTGEKLFLITGFLNIKEEEVKLYRVLDLSLTRSFWQRILNMGTLTIKSNDKSLPTVILKNIKRPKQVKELISDFVEKERLAKRVGSSEMMGLHDGPVDLDGDGIPDMPPAPTCGCDAHLD